MNNKEQLIDLFKEAMGSNLYPTASFLFDKLRYQFPTKKEKLLLIEQIIDPEYLVSNGVVEFSPWNAYQGKLSKRNIAFIFANTHCLGFEISLIEMNKLIKKANKKYKFK